MRIHPSILAAVGLVSAAILAPPQSHAMSPLGSVLAEAPPDLAEKAHTKRTCWWRDGKRHCRNVTHRHRWGKRYGYGPGINLYIGPSRHGVHRGHRNHRNHR